MQTNYVKQSVVPRVPSVAPVGTTMPAKAFPGTNQVVLERRQDQVGLFPSRASGW